MKVKREAREENELDQFVRDKFKFKDDDKYFDISKASVPAVYDVRDYETKLDVDAGYARSKSIETYKDNSKNELPKHENKFVNVDKFKSVKGENVIVDESMLDDIPDIVEDLKPEETFSRKDKEKSTNTSSGNQTFDSSGSYASNLINNNIEVKKVSDVIDLGPIAEEDEIFSTPRRDAEMEDDYASYPTMSKKELKKQKALEKKAKKHGK